MVSAIRRQALKEKLVTIALGVIADDYTGASDLANALNRNGLATIQTIGVPDDRLALPPVDAVVIALKSRSIAAHEAVERTLAAERWLRGRGAAHVLFKICSTFDSTDAGNIGPVTDALADACGEQAVLVNPSFPETKRTVYQGHLFVGDRPLDESPLKDHPLNPMHDADLVRVLARQSGRPVGLADLATVAAGAEALGRRRTELAAQGKGAVIADAIFESDLETIGRVAAESRLSVGASGIGIGLARALVATGKAKVGGQHVKAAPVGGPAICIVGSCSHATLGQIRRAEQVMPVLRLDVERLMHSSVPIAEAIKWVGERLSQGPALIASSGEPEEVLALQVRFGRDRVGHAIEQAMATLAEALVARGVHRLIVAGGETSGAVVDRLALPAFLIGEEIAAGVPVLHAVGGVARMSLALKSGNFGGPDFFVDALSAVC
jgi:3-dehydrotetronate 4-kinase